MFGAGASNAVYGAGGLKSYFPLRRNDLYVLHSATNLANAQRAESRPSRNR